MYLIWKKKGGVLLLFFCTCSFSQWFRSLHLFTELNFSKCALWIGRRLFTAWLAFVECIDSVCFAIYGSRNLSYSSSSTKAWGIFFLNYLRLTRDTELKNNFIRILFFFPFFLSNLSAIPFSFFLFVYRYNAVCTKCNL